jgi:cardiolipin synthase
VIWLLYALILLLLHGMILSLFVILETRRPASTLAWILALLFIPFFGAFFYFLFGRRRFVKRRRHRATTLTHFDRRSRMERMQSDREVTELSPFALEQLESRSQGIKPDTTPMELPPLPTAPPPVPEESTEVPHLHEFLINIARNNLHSSLAIHNHVDVLVDGDNTFNAMGEAIRNAKHHVHVLYYIFRKDATGTWLRDLLIERAKAGVEVRLVVDGIGSMELDDEFLQPLKEAGVEFAVFLPFRFQFRLRRSQVNFRNHRKIVIVDGWIGFTGGVNVGEEYRGRSSHGYWRDTHVRLEGPAVHELQHVFAEDWFYTTQRKIAGRDYFPLLEENGEETVQIIPSGPDLPSLSIHHLFFVAITSARRYVWITTPYFVPDDSILLALQTAALRGVDVRLLVPFESDEGLVLHAGRSYYNELLEAGVRIFEYKKGILHAKTMVIDGTCGTIGSANMDIRSFHLNFELNAFLYSEKVAHSLETTFLEDLKHSQAVSLSSRLKRPVRQRLRESAARLLSPIL